MPKQTLAEEELRRLARLGAIARLKEIETEAAAIRSAFPGLGGTQPAKERTAAKPARRKRHMSPAAREAARQRMQAYWARRKAEAAAPGNGGADRATDAPVRKAKRARTKKTRAKKTR